MVTDYINNPRCRLTRYLRDGQFKACRIPCFNYNILGVGSSEIERTTYCVACTRTRCRKNSAKHVVAREIWERECAAGESDFNIP